MFKQSDMETGVRIRRAREILWTKDLRLLRIGKKRGVLCSHCYFGVSFSLNGTKGEAGHITTCMMCLSLFLGFVSPAAILVFVLSLQQSLLHCLSKLRRGMAWSVDIMFATELLLLVFERW